MDGWHAAPSTVTHTTTATTTATAVAPHTVTIAGTFATDALEGPLVDGWLTQLLGVSNIIKMQWAPYSQFLDELPGLLCGPSHGGAEQILLLVRLEDLCIVHPESRHAPITKKAVKQVETKQFSSGDESTRVLEQPDIHELNQEDIDRQQREKYGCANLDQPEDQLKDACTKLDEILQNREDPSVAIHLLLFPAPPPKFGNRTKEWAAAAQHAEQWLCNRKWALSGLGKVTSSSVLLERLFNLHDDSARSDSLWYNRKLDRLAHAPFTSSMMEIAACVFARSLHRQIFRATPKVVALDCDNTLWGGAVAEVGAQGVILTDGFLSLQRFFVSLHNRGVLLCLCSRNSSQADVLDVWKYRGDEMILKLENIVTHAISWDRKSAGLRNMAEYLHLGLESFVLVDDSPSECAEVANTLAQVGIVQLPGDSKLFEKYLDECWIFDASFSTGSVSTSTDANRTQLYKQVAQRSEAHASFDGGLPAWIASLNITISFSPLTIDNVDRAAQLTERTSQMNAHKRPRSITELLSLCSINENAGMYNEQSSRGICVTVRDRFGDHGLVGLIVCDQNTEVNHGKSFHVDTFLLSCRSLHLGVEHAMMRHISKLASTNDKKYIAISWAPSERNDAACHFFSAIDGCEFIADKEFSRPNGVEPADEQNSYQQNTESNAGQVEEEPFHKRVKLDEFMTPELTSLSQRQRKKELRRRYREAQKQDEATQRAKKASRAARRAAQKAVRPRGVEKVSQHVKFGTKPDQGHVLLPTKSATNLIVGVNGLQVHKSEDPIISTKSLGEQRPVRKTTSNKLVALHHETIFANAIALSTADTSFIKLMASTCRTEVVNQLLQQDDLKKSSQEDTMKRFPEAELKEFIDSNAMRTIARDQVKVMIQKANPATYKHVRHNIKEDDVEDILSQPKILRFE